MRLFSSLIGVALLFSVRTLAAGADSFSEFDPKLGEVDLKPVANHVGEPPPPQIMEDPSELDQHNADLDSKAAQDKSRNYKPKLKLADKAKAKKKVALKPVKKTASRKAKRNGLLATSAIQGSRKPSSTIHRGHWMYHGPG